MQREGVTHEVTGVLVQPELLVNLVHGAGRAQVLPGLGVLLGEVLGPHQEVLEPPLLEEPHQVRGQRLLLISGNLDSGASLLILELMNHFFTP